MQPKSSQQRILSQQVLGLRPRLTSEEVGDYEAKDQPNFSFSSISTDFSPTTRRDRSFSFGSKNLSLIESESFYQETDVGFRLLGLDEESEKDPTTEEDEDFADSELPFEIDEEGTEGIAVAKYKKRCEEIRNLSLFRGEGELWHEMGKVLSEWKRRRCL